jgi:hypothetical protein
MPEQFLDRAIRSSPACVTYHRPSRSSRSPRDTNRLYSSVRVLSVRIALRDSPPQVALASLLFERKRLRCAFTLLPMAPNVTHIMTLGSIFVKVCERSNQRERMVESTNACEKTPDFRFEFDQTLRRSSKPLHRRKVEAWRRCAKHS